MPSSTKLKTKHNKSLLISSSVFSLLLVTTLVSGLVLSGTRTHADDTTQSDNVTVTVSSACTLSRSAGSGTYSASLNPGQETGDISGSTIKAICNDGNGYSLYAIGYSGDSYTDNNTKMIGTYGNIDTGTSGDNSWWAMKLAPVTGTYAPTIVDSFDSYHVVPATFTQVAKLTSATDAGESATGSSVDAFYKVKASTSQVAGTYTGKVKYTLVHPNSNVAGTYTIAFNANGGTGTMASQTGLYNFEEQTLNTMSGITAPSGYKFAGWCDVQDSNATSTNPQTTCAGTSYADAGTVPPSVATNGGTYILYAMWAQPCAGYTTMQGLTSSAIASLLPNVGSTATVCDVRDENTYTIAKLADGKYWMVSNLNLAGGTTLNAGDSNVPSDNYYTLPTSTAISSGTSVPSDQFSNDSTAYVFNTGNNTTTCTSSTPCNSYYSWLAATAGGKDSSGNAVTGNGYNAAYSICPKGWKLPTSTTSNAPAQTSPNWKTGDWYTLMTAYGANLESNYYNSSDTNFYTNAGPGTIPNFLLAGYYNSGSFTNGGSYGYYWSATSYSSTDGYRGSFSSSYVYSADYNSRRRGRSVRCLFAE